MKASCRQFADPAQTGFVPNRFICETTHLTKLIQEHLNHTHKPGGFVFLDMEKAFDRASWQFMDQALDDVGLGDFRDYFRLAYSSDNAPTRRVHANGYLSRPFPIKPGVAQGCPLSPLLFLLVTEVITRLHHKRRKVPRYRSGWGPTQNLSVR